MELSGLNGVSKVVRALQVLLISVVLLITTVWLGKRLFVVPQPISEATSMARCTSDGGKPVRAMFAYFCIPTGLNVVSDYAHH